VVGGVRSGGNSVLAALAQAIGAGRGSRLYVAAASVLLLVGVVLRVLGYFDRIEFWGDEAGWALQITVGAPATIRPVGYVWISKWLIDLHNTEPVVRSLSFVSGILSLPVFLGMCRQAGLSRPVTLFGLFILAAHPAAVDLTKEFKPYSLELFLHLLLLWLAFVASRMHRAGTLVALCLAAAIAPLFSWSIVVVYPGLFLTLAACALRGRRLSALLVASGGAMATLGMLLAIYLARLRGGELTAAYWGAKYDVFYLGSGLGGQLRWLLGKTYDVASFPAKLKTFWLDRSVGEVFEVLVVAWCLVGAIAVLAGRRWPRAGLWLSPWVVTIALNLAGWWPYGTFRTNLFLLAYSLPLALVGLDVLHRWLSERLPAPRPGGRVILPLIAGLCVLAFFPTDLDYFASGKGSGMAGNCHARRAIEAIYEAERDQPPPPGRRPIVLDRAARGVYAYYRNNHVETRRRYRDFLRERYWRCCPGRTLEDAIDYAAGSGFWLLACNARSAVPARRYALRRCLAVDHLEDFPHGGVMLRCLGRAE
jgi:hypothetical protein